MMKRDTGDVKMDVKIPYDGMVSIQNVSLRTYQEYFCILIITHGDSTSDSLVKNFDPVLKCDFEIQQSGHTP
jgi:hypothetical protein